MHISYCMFLSLVRARSTCVCILDLLCSNGASKGGHRSSFVLNLCFSFFLFLGSLTYFPDATPILKSSKPWWHLLADVSLPLHYLSSRSLHPFLRSQPRRPRVAARCQGVRGYRSPRPHPSCPFRRHSHLTALRNVLKNVA